MRRRPLLATTLGAVVIGVPLAVIADSERARAGSTIGTADSVVTLIAAPPLLTNQTSATFAFTSTPVAKKYECRLDGARFATCVSPHVYSSLSNGSHTFDVFAPSRGKLATTYTWTIDTVPPETTTELRRAVGYGRLQLRWKKPADSDFDHVEVYVSTSRRSQPQTLVYRGRAAAYSNRRFKNGLYYRYRVVSVDRAKNPSRGASTTIPPSVLLKSPAEGRIVHRAPVLRWTRVRHATFYNVQLYRNGGKILSGWPTKPRQALSRGWTYAGRRIRLKRGLYVWYVWPAFGSSAKGRYGQLLGQGSFKFQPE
jgi:hypothetical protein